MLIDKGIDFPKKFKKFTKSCKPCYALLCTRRSEYRTWKRLAGFIYGFLLGIGFYYMILVDLDFTEDAAFFVGTFICLMLAFGCAFSAQIRCIILLTFPNIGGKVGRGVLKAIVLAVLISGPIENLTDNGKEVVRVFACTTALTFNLTKTRIKLMFKPFADAIKSMKTDVSEIKDTVRSIKDMSAPVIGEVENEEEMKKIKEENDYLDEILGDTKRSKLLEDKFKEASNFTSKGEIIEAEHIQKMYVKKIEMKCEDQFTKAANKCREVFAKGYDSCYDTVTWLAAWLLCWPMKLDFICNIVESLGGAGKCDPSKYIGSGFGEGYMYLKKSRKTFADNFKNVRLQFKVMKVPKIKELIDAKDAAKAVLHDVMRKKEIIMAILVVLKRLLAFLFLRILLNCQTYHDHYLRDIEFDNRYITKYFRKIDHRRLLQEKHTLLPLKKIERIKLVDPWTPRPLKSEKEEIIKSSITLLIEMITATTFILLDRLFYEAMDLVRRHGKIDYVQTGKHDLKLEIKGTGLIASLLRSVIKGFNVKKRIHIEASNEHCLPNPNLLLNYYIYKIYGIYFAIWLLIIGQAYTQRLRRIICAYFYRKREKRRVLYLYNETLRRRIGFFRFMKKKIQKMAREHRLKENLNLCTILRVKYPNRCDCLRFFAYARRKCLICEDPEPRNGGDFIECPTPNCHMLYCKECWIDLGKHCFACASEGSDTSSGIESMEEDI